MSNVTLREISHDNIRSLCRLAVRKDQETSVVSSSIAIAEACYREDEWIRAVFAGDEPRRPRGVEGATRGRPIFSVAFHDRCAASAIEYRAPGNRTAD